MQGWEVSDRSAQLPPALPAPPGVLQGFRELRCRTSWAARGPVVEHSGRDRPGISHNPCSEQSYPPSPFFHLLALPLPSSMPFYLQSLFRPAATGLELLHPPLSSPTSVPAPPLAHQGTPCFFRCGPQRLLCNTELSLQPAELGLGLIQAPASAVAAQYRHHSALPLPAPLSQPLRRRVGEGGAGRGFDAGG